jgi:hypothetical protein
LKAVSELMKEKQQLVLKLKHQIIQAQERLKHFAEKIRIQNKIYKLDFDLSLKKNNFQFHIKKI